MERERETKSADKFHIFCCEFVLLSLSLALLLFASCFFSLSLARFLYVSFSHENTHNTHSHPMQKGGKERKANERTRVHAFTVCGACENELSMRECDFLLVRVAAAATSKAQQKPEAVRTSAFFARTTAAAAAAATR